MSNHYVPYKTRQPAVLLNASTLTSQNKTSLLESADEFPKNAKLNVFIIIRNMNYFTKGTFLLIILNILSNKNILNA